ncbi:hypothetical protein ACQUZK_09305 [Streptococcus pyogenes]|uniref:hypothetical protein n=1 Tax=Streptococcus pyogenes TaxID=1314 RepID=UPI003D9FB725
MNHQAVQDWLQIRRQLLQMEADFTSLALKVASGDETEERMQQQRQVLEATRELCTAAYERAFPKSRGTGGATSIPSSA